MIHVVVKPATRTDSGYMRVTGHAGTVDVCNAVTTLFEALAANLDGCWDINMRRKAEPGDAELIWYKTDRQGRGVSRANQSAGFVYRALMALARTWHGEVSVNKETPGFRQRKETTT